MINYLLPEILFNIIKYNPKIIDSKKITIDNKKLYYYLCKENEIKTPYYYSKKSLRWIDLKENENEIYRTAILNREEIIEETRLGTQDTLWKKLKNGKLMVCVGKNNDGAKINFVKNNEKLQLIPKIKNVVKIAGDTMGVIILLNDGTIQSFGENEAYELGLNHDKPTKNFKKVKNIQDVVDIFYGSQFTYLLLKSGEIMSCGDNGNNQLGYETIYNFVYKFEKVPGINNVKKVIPGIVTILLLNNGDLVSSNYHDDKISSNGNLFQKIPIDNVDNIEHGAFHIVLLLKSGEIMVHGNFEQEGQLGLGDVGCTYKFTIVKNIKNVKKVICGYFYTILLLENGHILGSGQNDCGQLGFKDRKNRYKFERLKHFEKYGEIKDICCEMYGTIIKYKNGKTLSTYKGKKLKMYNQ